MGANDANVRVSQRIDGLVMCQPRRTSGGCVLGSAALWQLIKMMDNPEKEISWEAQAPWTHGTGWER